MKYITALLCSALLTACVGDGNTTPTVTDIQAAGLNYAVRAQFDFTGTYLDKGLSATIANCASQTPTFISPTRQVLQCVVTAVGDLKVEVRDGSGSIIFSKTFTVPPPRVALATTLGNVIVELDTIKAPLTSNNFLRYVQGGFYPNTIFHRVIAGFIAQGGGYTSGLVAAPGLFAPIALESNNGLSNLRGTIAMARTADPASATSQFYFNLADNTGLDYRDAANPGYAVFGSVVLGTDVMDAIGATPTAAVGGVTDVPVTDVAIRTALRIQ